GTQLAALNAQDMGGAAQLQGFAMSLGTTDVLSINTPIGEYVPGGTPQSTSDLARKAVDSFCEQQDLPKSEFDPRTTAAMVDPNGNITYGGLVCGISGSTTRLFRRLLTTFRGENDPRPTDTAPRSGR